MKTVFKKGMKVYDQLIFPDKEGIVLTINYKPEKIFDEDDFDENYVHPYPIEVEFGSETMLYTSDGDSGMCGVKTLSTKPYKVNLQGFEQKASAPTYEEALVKAKTNFNGYPSYELAMAAEALQKLLFLRDYYNKGWRPDWSNTNVLKYVIIVSREKIEIDNTYNIKRILAFNSKEIRNKFLEEQKELLEIAKPLL